MEDKYINCLIGFNIGDAIGYKNGEWKNLPNSDKFFQFISLGGINSINTKSWKAGINTILSAAMGLSLNSEYNTVTELGNILRKELIDCLKIFELRRISDEVAIDSILKLQSGTQWNGLDYDLAYRDSVGASRCLLVGICYYQKKDIKKLIEMSIESCRITHNHTIGFLGGVTVALFASYAMRNIAINKWPHKLMKLHKSKMISDYIKKVGRNVDEYFRDAEIFFGKWDNYIKSKFSDEGDIVIKRTTMNLMWRNKYYYDLTQRSQHFIAQYADDCTIVVYDCLLDAREKWETLVFYSILHAGYTDITGSIAGGLYGIIYGLKNIPTENQNLEHKDDFINLAKKLYVKFSNDKE